MAVNVPSRRSAPASSPRQTPGITVVGWLMVCFSMIPILFGIHERSHGSLAVGLVMLAAGVAAALVGRKVALRSAPR